MRLFNDEILIALFPDESWTLTTHMAVVTSYEMKFKPVTNGHKTLTAILTHETVPERRSGTHTGILAVKPENHATRIKPAKNPASRLATQGLDQVTPAGFEPTFSG